MQQRDLTATMEAESENQGVSPQSRGRVLTRSHAMREEASPPREPSPSHPFIKLIPSPANSPAASPTHQYSCNKPAVVSSPSISRGNSPSALCVSPTSTLVPSPMSRCSPQSISSGDNSHSKLVVCTQCSDAVAESNLGHQCETQIVVDETSQIENRKVKNEITYCDCISESCPGCLKNQERNLNNNLSSSINNNFNPNTLSVNRGNPRGKLRQQSSSQGSFEGSSSNSPCLSRDSSSEQYTDTTGIDLDQFIAETLNRNAKDRALMLRIEQELVSLAKDKTKTHFKFPPMSSYQRMLVHRCAAYFGMDHNIESSGKCVVVNKTKCTRIPEIEFREHVKDDIIFSDEPRRSILKRDSSGTEDYSFKSPDRQLSLENRRSKSFEEREEEYEKAKRRIFNKELHDCGSADEFGWAEIPWSSTDSENSSRFQRLQLPDTVKPTARLLKVQSVETGGETSRPFVAKSYSFGGYGGVSVLTRGDSVMSTHSAGARLLTKQDSAASSVSWRLSPSSSGYKSQSQISESVTPSPTSTPNPMNETTYLDSYNKPWEEHYHNQDQTQLMWAVTDIHSVPKGSVIINPESCCPYKNEDGSIYHYDPCNLPPHFNKTWSKPPPSPQKPSSPLKVVKERALSPKKRSRSSPSKKINFINSATSPSLPYTPPLPQSRSMQYIPETNYSVQQYPINYGPLPVQENTYPMYQPPCIVYTPYGVPMQPHFDGRIEPQVQEVPSPYYVTENSSMQSVAYPPANPYWNQPVSYYQNPPPANPPPPPSQRYTVPVSGPPGPFISTTYPSNYGPQPTHGLHQNQNPEMIPLYPHQPVQMVYSSPPAQPNSVIYPNQSLIYAQNPVYSQSLYHSQNVPYPQCTSTSSSTSTASNKVLHGQLQEQNLAQAGYGQLAQNMTQLSLNSGPMNMPMGQGMAQLQQFDMKMDKTGKGNKFSNPKRFVSGSSQSSTGTNSPATTVIAGYCNNQTILYRTPSETPPTRNGNSNFIAPMVFRQMNNIRASPPIGSRTSGSPTPINDMPLIDKNRFSLPPNIYQGMPYVIQADNKMTGRNQPNNYKPIRQQVFSQGVDNFNKSHRNRKSSRSNKGPGLPPNGRQLNP